MPTGRTADLTEAQCFLPGVPRATYMPFPFQITHTPTMIAISYEFAHAMRPIVMDGSPHPEVPDQNWMGISRGHWEGDTLVVDVRISMIRHGSITPGITIVNSCK